MSLQVAAFESGSADARMVSKPSFSPSIAWPPENVALQAPPPATVPVAVFVRDPSVTVTVTSVPAVKFDDAPVMVTEPSSLAFQTPAEPMPPPLGSSIDSVGPTDTGFAADIVGVNVPSEANVEFLS